MSAAGRGAERIESDNYPTPSWCVRRMLEVAPWDGDVRNDHTEGLNHRILEPCAGEGAIVRELRVAYANARIEAVELRDAPAALMQKQGANAWILGTDALTTEWGGLWDLVLTNPPFSLWHDFARKGIASARWTCLLLRIGAAAHLTQKDSGGVPHTLPAPSLYILPNRPQFVRSFKCKGGGEWRSSTKRRISDSLSTEYEAPIMSHQPCGWRDTIAIDAPVWAACPRCGGKVQHSSSDASEYAWFVWGPQAPIVHILADTPLAERKAA